MRNLRIHIPKLKELSYRKRLLSDPATMEYNVPWGGTIDFSESNWDDWYNRWIENPLDKFYGYLVEVESNKPIGEISYRYDEEFHSYMTNIIIEAKHRGKGYGKEGLKLLIDYAFNNCNIEKLQDNISIHSKGSHKLFESLGFKSIRKTEEYILFELNK